MKKSFSNKKELGTTKKRRSLRTLVLVLSAMVVFTTTYMLILPALTLDEQEALRQGGIDLALEDSQVENVNAEADESVTEEAAVTDDEAAPEDTEQADTEIVSDETEDLEVTETEEVKEPEQKAEKEEVSEPEKKVETEEVKEPEKSESKEEKSQDTELIKTKTDLTAEGDGFNVTATVNKKSEVPATTELSVEEMTKDHDDYDKYAEKAYKAVDEEMSNVADVKILGLYDISLKSEGEAVEPNNKVNVSINYDKGAKITDADNIRIVHFGEKKTEVLEAETTLERSKLSETSFDTDSFSPFAVVEFETLSKQITAADGNTYEVTVTYGPDAKIPEGSTLSVKGFDTDSEEYKQARKAVLADKKEKGESIDLFNFNLAALDISIIDPAGKEIEPAAAVNVDLKIMNLPGVEDLKDVKDTIEVQHHVETEDGVIVEKVFDGKTSASFEQATNEEIIADKNNVVIDPSSVSEKEFEHNDEEIIMPEISASFETGAFSTYTISWGSRRYNINYVDTNGNSLTPTRTPEFSNGFKFLIYDIEGYEYDSTHYGSRTGTAIKPLLANYGNDRVYLDNSNNWQYLRNDIYVVYKAKATPTTGGTPQVDQDETWPEGENAPQFGKSSVNNGNGTNTISLTIKGGEKPVTKTSPADVIVVFDVSGSMDENLSGNTKRLAAAKTAVNKMADTLLNGANNDVRMALVSFSTDAQIVQGFTDNYTTFSGKVNNLQADGGTNWEKALKIANEMDVRSNAATFVVFVTDGDPTFRVSRGDVSDSNLDLYSDGTYQYYRNNYVFGEGNDDSDGRNFDFAVDQVKAIDGANKSFYAIGISNSVTKVRNLTTQGGVAADHAFTASDNTAMTNAFNSITQSIRSVLGFGDIEITDGITNLTNAEMKVMQDVDPNSFKYYKIDSTGEHEWTTREADGCAPATYNKEKGAVEWNMGETFQLEQGVTYKVTFRVWPKEEAYDLVAELNNGTKVYAEGQANSITAAEREQIVEIKAPTATEQGQYALKTNTNEVSATYNKTTKSGDVVSVSDTHDITATYTEGTIQNMGLESMKLTIKKEFEDDLTSGEDRDPEVILVLKRRVANQDPAGDFAEYAVPQGGGSTSANIVLNAGNNWQYSLYVAPGLKVGNDILEPGYDFTVTEPDIDYHYDLIEEIINPMIVNGEDTYYGDGELITGETISQYIDRSITAVNRVKSGIDITKNVYDTDGTTKIYPDTEFTITGKLLGPDGEPYTWHDGDSENASGAYHKYDKDGNRIVYKGHFADSSNISFTLKAGERIRFINVPEGCTFEFTETTSGMADKGYEWKSTDAVTQHRVSAGGDFTTEGDVQPTVSGQTASISKNADGTGGVVGNKQYSVTFGNKRTIPLPDVELVKIDKDDNTKKLNDAEFTLYSDEELTKPVTTDGNGKAISIKTGNKDNSAGPDGWYHIGTLPAGTYYLVETDEPTGYVLDETPVVITVTKGTNNYSITAVKDGKSVISGPTDGRYTITLDNELNRTEAEAHKAWVNADGTTTAPQGGNVTFTLYADGDATDHAVTLDGVADETVPEAAGGYESEGWTAKFVNLPKYKVVEGEAVEIVYTIGETTTYPGYTPSTTEPVANGETITNTQVKAETVNALKAWKNADGTTTAPSGASVVYTLYADGVATSYTVTLDGTADTAPTGTAGYESEAWKAAFVNLPKYKVVEGEAVVIVYTISETTTYPGYTPSTTGAVASGETITNEQGSTGTYAEKAWKNADGTTTAPSGASVVYTLYADGKATNYTVTLDGTVDTAPAGTGGYESAPWKAEFVNLPKYKAGTTTEIVYTIAETTGYPGYTASTTEPVGSGSVITNTQETVDNVNALKAWKNADGTTTAPQGGQVTYTLYADGAATDYTVTLDGTVDTAPTVTGGYESEAWKAAFVNLPKYKAGTTTVIVYTIGETTTYPGYTPSTDKPVASGETITNTQETVDNVNALKAWKNADGTTTAPSGASVVYTLYADGAATSYTVTLDGAVDETVPEATAGYESEAWKAAFVNLPKYKVVEGKAVEISYTIGETTTYPGYTPSTDKPVASGETITNAQDAVSVDANKAWKNADETTTAPENATVVYTLYADGEATSYTVTLDGAVDETVPEATAGYESEPWKATFTNLPKYKADGTTEITYTIAETTGYTGYKASTTEPVPDGGKITNSQLSAEIKLIKIGDAKDEIKLNGAEFKLYSVWKEADDPDNKVAKDISGQEIGTIKTENGGLATIGKLLPGKYYLVETKAPDGYNLLKDPVEINIVLSEEEPGYTVSYYQADFSATNGIAALEPGEDGAYTIKVNNNSGKALPMTGGTGTTIFYLIGGILVVISGLMLIRKKRTN